MLIQGVDKGPKLFSMESDGWEEPRRGVSTRPALVPARQGTEELPEAAVVVVSVWRWKHMASGN